MKKNLAIIIGGSSVFLVFFIKAGTEALIKKIDKYEATAKIKHKEDLQENAGNELNKTFPVTRQGVRIDRAEALPHGIIQLNHTLVSQSKSEIGMSRAASVSSGEFLLCVLHALRAADVREATQVFSYRDKKGVLVCELKRYI